MDNRFVDASFFQTYRKLESRLKMLFLYGWLNADDCGVYAFDTDYIAVDLQEDFDESDFDNLPQVIKISPQKYLFVDFISICYKTLKEDYNPHKPAFRALLKHSLTLNGSKNQAIFKLDPSLLNGNENSNGNGNENGGDPKIDLFDMFWKSYPKNNASAYSIRY